MKKEIPSRRTLLRGALAVGCSLFVPLAFAEPTAIKKMTKASAKYQAKPKGELKCSQCMNFLAEMKSCKLVEGAISADGWCSLWAKKA